jgi:hypothetical protein
MHIRIRRVLERIPENNYLLTRYTCSIKMRFKSFFNRKYTYERTILLGVLPFMRAVSALLVRTSLVKTRGMTPG